MVNFFGHFRQTDGVQSKDCNCPKQWASLVGHAFSTFLIIIFLGFNITSSNLSKISSALSITIILYFHGFILLKQNNGGAVSFVQ